MASWSSGTKEKLLKAAEEIKSFVLNKWQSGSLQDASVAWRNFVESESEDAKSQGFAIRNIENDGGRGFRYTPYTGLMKADFINQLGSQDREIRERVFSDLDELMKYFYPWDYEENEALPRGRVASDGSVGNVNVNRVRFRILDEEAKLEKQIADAKMEIIKKEAEEYAKIVGVSASESIGDTIKGIYEKHGNLLIGSGAVFLIALGYAVWRGKR